MPDFTVPDSKLEKVRKLLAKAEDASKAGRQSEAEAYNAKATELMASHGIDMAMLGASDPTLDVVGDKMIKCEWPYARSKATLLWEIAGAMNCRAIRIDKPTASRAHRYDVHVHLFGYESDRAMVELMFTSLLLQAANESVHTPVPYGSQKAAFRETWMLGFAEVIGQRLRAMFRKVQAEAGASTPGVALVLADRGQVAARAFREAYPSTVPLNRRVSGNGRAAGRAAGARADLGGGARVGAGSRTEISR